MSWTQGFERRAVRFFPSQVQRAQRSAVERTGKRYRVRGPFFAFRISFLGLDFLKLARELNRALVRLRAAVAVKYLVRERIVRELPS